MTIIPSENITSNANPNLQHFEKDEEGVRFRISNQTLLDTYYFNLRPLLQTPNIDELVDEDIESEHIEKEEERDATDKEEFTQLLPEEEPKSDQRVKKRKKKKLKRRKAIQRDADYDFDDPFIDDSEAVNAYVSIFDLMAGRVEEDEFDTMEIIEDSEEEDDKIITEEVSKKSMLPDEERAKDFFVYQGPLIEQTEKEFEIPKKRRKPISPTKAKSSTKSTSPKKKLTKKSSPKSQTEKKELTKESTNIKEDTFTVDEKDQPKSETNNTIVKIKSKKRPKESSQVPGMRKSEWISLPNTDNLSIKEALRNIGIVEFPRFKFCNVDALDLDEQ